MSPTTLSAMVAVLLLATLPMVAVSSADPSDPAPADTSDSGAPQRVRHLHLGGRGSDKATLAVEGDDLRVPRFASQQDGAAWHACAGDDQNPSAARTSSDEDRSHFASLLGARQQMRGLPVGKVSAVDVLVELARGAAEPSMAVSLILNNPQGMEPGDVWKTMSCAVLISEQNGGAWEGKEAEQLRAMGFFSKEDVLNQLGVIGWPSDCSEPITLDRNSM